MLRWQQTPDHVFTEIVTETLGITIDRLNDALEECAIESFDSSLVGMFTQEELVSEFRKLLEAHQSKQLWMPTDYHFLLLYRALELHCEYHNECWPDCPSMMIIGPYVIADIDFSSLSESYFWDLDFLISRENFDNLSPMRKSALGLSEETFGVVHGMKPHPDELKLKEHPNAPASPVQPERYRRGLTFPFDEDFVDSELTLAAHQAIALKTHWEESVLKAVASLPDSVSSKITVSDNGRLLQMSGCRLYLYASLSPEELEVNESTWRLGDDPDTYPDVIREAAASAVRQALDEENSDDWAPDF